MANSKDQPLVSIITPAHNAGPYLRDTIGSVLSQTYNNFEHIIVDDGSTDDTAEVVRSFTDPRIKYMSQKNSGQSSARNAAIKVAKGKYIALLDADDIFYPEKLSEQVAYMEQHPDCEFCYCKIHHFFHEKPHDRYYFAMEHPSGYLFGKLLVSNFINPLSAMVRREVFEKHGAFEPKFRWADEQYLWLKLAYKKVKFCYLDKVLGACRLHPESFTNRPFYFQGSQEQCLDILRLMRSWMTEEEARKYRMDALEAKTKKRILIGKIMAKNNFFGRLVHTLYLYNRRRRLEIVKQ
ncbi:MAG: glycosyltransferase family 2 protein [Patescibacteria group bacterium]